MKIKAVIDRIEEGTAVLFIRPDEKDELHWPVNHLPDNAKEGDILNIIIEVDQEETERTKERVRSLIDKLKKKNADKQG